MTSDSIEDVVDIKRLKQGDEAALKQFFDFLVPRLYRYGTRQGFFTPLDVEDIVNETILRIFKRIDSIAEVENLYGYCLAVMRNVIREHYRRAQKTRMIEKPLDNIVKQEDTDAALQVQFDEDALLDLEHVFEAKQALDKALSELSDRDRELVLMRISELSFDEIATSLGVSTPAVRARYYRIIRALKHTFENHYREVRKVS